MKKNKKTAKRLIILSVVIVLIVGGAVGLWMFLQYKNDQKTVEVIPVSQITDYYWGDDATSYGMVVSDYVQELYPDSTKTVSEIFVTEGQEVHVGDPLLQYDKEALELDRDIKQVNLTQADLDISNAQKQLRKLENTKPLSTARPTAVPRPTNRPVVTPRPTSRPTATPTPTPVPPADVTLYSRLDLDSLPYKGSGTSEDPYVFLCTGDCVVTPEFMRWLLGVQSPTPTPAPTPEQESSGLESQPEEDGETSSLPEDESSLAPTPTPEPTPEPASPLASPFAALFEVRDGNSNYGQLISAFKLDGTKLAANFQLSELLTGYNTLDSIATMFGATPTPAPTANANNYNDMGYTAAQLKQLINEKKQEIQTLQLARKQAKLDLDKATLLLQNSTVLSTVDGLVRTLTDQETAAAEGKPFLVVSGAETYYVKGAVSENILGIVQVGDPVTVTDYMTGNTYTAQIVSIADYPLEGDSGMYFSGAGNPNSSNYEFTALLDPSGSMEALQNGQNVEISLSVQEEGGADTLYIQKAYVREDDAGSYVMKAGIDDRLTKQYVQTGKSIYGGSSLEIRSGLTIDDYVAFPYGTDVKDGVRVVIQGTDKGPIASGAGGGLSAELPEEDTGLQAIPTETVSAADAPAEGVPAEGGEGTSEPYEESSESFDENMDTFAAENEGGETYD